MNESGKQFSREEIYEAVWSKPIKTLARDWNTTYLWVVHACDLMEVPRPRHGHWQQIAHGHTILREPLPEPTGNIPETVSLPPDGPGQQKSATIRQRATEEKPDLQEPAKEIPSAPQNTIEEEDLPQVAERAVLDIIRQATRINFWQESISEWVYLGGLKGWLGLGEGVTATRGQLQSALKKVRKEYRSFVVGVEEKKNQYDQSHLVIDIVLRDGCEWRDAWEEAWTFAQKPNAYCLSDNALRLYLWASGPKNTGKLTARRKIGAQSRLQKTYDHIERHLQEIRLKADSSIQWEDDKKGWHGQMRVWFEKRNMVFYHHGPLNPVLGLNVREVGHAELERFKKWLYEEILKPGFPEGTEVIGIFDIQDRKTLKTAFSKLPDDCGKYGSMPRFFDAVKVVDGIEIRRGFEDGAGPWLVICQLQEGATWAKIKARLKAKAEEIPLEKKYRLSADSRSLLQWILDLRSDEYLRQMTPLVEERLEKEIGIEAKWDEKNWRSYLDLLVEEINDQTEFKLRTITWHSYSKELTRILVKKREADLEAVVRAIQVFALSKNKLLDSDRVRTAMNSLMAKVEEVAGNQIMERS